MLIDQAIEQVGLNVIAQRMTVSAQRVSNWRTRGIPGDQVLSFCKAIEWKITPHELRPDVYPNSSDGLPANLDQAAA